MKEKKLNLKDYIEIVISNAIEYDNKHHCFQLFALAFSISTLIVITIVLIKSSK